MKHFSFLMLLTAGLFAASIFLNACQKEVGQEAAQTVQGVSPVSDRAASHTTYGVTLFDGANPCKIYGLDQATGGVISSTTAFYVDPGTGDYFSLDNLKGICLTSWGEYFITTGSPASLMPSTLDNSLFRVNLSTGKCDLVSTNLDGNTVSDLEHTPSGDLNFYGLSNNSNAIIEISKNYGPAYTTYSAPAAITGITPGYILKGLSLVRNSLGGMYLVGCATSGPFLPAKLYVVPPLGGAATFITDLTPVSDLGGGHCALGFDFDLNKMLVNKNTPGLNGFNWTVSLGAITSTSFWSGSPYSCEDLTSSVY